MIATNHHPTDAMLFRLFSILGAVLLYGGCTTADLEITITPLAASEVPLAENRIAFANASDSLQNLDFRVAERFRPGSNADRLTQTLRHVTEGRYDDALVMATILQDSADGGLAILAFQMRQVLLREARAYTAWQDAQRAFQQTHPDYEPEAMSAMLAAMPEETFTFAETPYASTLTVGVTGSPLLAIQANGVDIPFWFDTGAAFTVIAASEAERLGVVSLDVAEALNVTTSTTKQVGARMGYFPNLKVGHLHVQNHPTFIIDDADLTFTLDDGQTLKLDGIIGWNLIRHIRAELDYADGTYLLTASTPNPSLERNLFWLGYPVVRGMTETGQPLLFGLDTGSRNTSLDENIFRKTTFTSITTDSVHIGGVGGFEWLPAQIATDFRFIVSDHLFHMPKAQSEVHEDVLFLAIDGVLGSDIARHMRMVVDFPNGHFSLRFPD